MGAHAKGYCAGVKRALLVWSTLLIAACGDQKRNDAQETSAAAEVQPQLSRIALPELDQGFASVDAAAISIFATPDGVGLVSEPGQQPRAIAGATPSSEPGIDRRLFDALLPLLGSSTLSAGEGGTRMVLASSPLALFGDAKLSAAAVARLAWTARAAGVVGPVLLVAQRGGARTGVPIRAPNPAGETPPTVIIHVSASGASVDIGEAKGDMLPAVEARKVLSLALAGQAPPAVGLMLHEQATHRDLMTWASMAVEVGAPELVLALGGSFQPTVPPEIHDEVQASVAAANKAVCDEQLPTLLDMQRADPNNESVYDAIARTYAGMCNDPAEESKWIRKRTEAFPDSADAWHALALRRLRAVLPTPPQTVNEAVPAAQRATRCDEVLDYLDKALAADANHRPSLQLTVIARHQRKLARGFEQPPVSDDDKREHALAILDGHLAWSATKRLCALDDVPDCDPEQPATGQCCPPAPYSQDVIDQAKAKAE